MWTSVACPTRSADIPGELVFNEAQRFQRLLERALDHAGEFVGAGRVEWFEGRAQGDCSCVGPGLAVTVKIPSERRTDSRTWTCSNRKLRSPAELSLIPRGLAAVGQLADPRVAVHLGGDKSGSHCRVAAVSDNTAQTSSGVPWMSMVVVKVGICGFLPRTGGGF